MHVDHGFRASQKVERGGGNAFGRDKKGRGRRREGWGQKGEMRRVSKKEEGYTSYMRAGKKALEAIAR